MGVLRGAGRRQRGEARRRAGGSWVRGASAGGGGGRAGRRAGGGGGGGAGGGDLARGEQAEVPNLHEARGQDVEQEAAEEFARGDGHAAAVFGGEADRLGGDGLEAVVGEADAVGVAAEVVDDLRRAAEGPLGIDDPLLAIELVEERAEGPGVGQAGDGGGELEVAALVGAP